jgi:hypothetical protein
MEIGKVEFLFNDFNLKKIEEVFVNVKYLMDSSEMISYDHYFSFDFK